MKKAFKFAAIAVVAMALTVACKSNKAEEALDTVDSMIEAVVEDTTDSIEVVAEEAEEPVKPVAKKADEKKTIKADETKTGDNKNVEDRLRKRQVENANMSNDETPVATTTEDKQKNVENRLKKR